MVRSLLLAALTLATVAVVATSGSGCGRLGHVAGVNFQEVPAREGYVVEGSARMPDKDPPAGFRFTREDCWEVPYYNEALKRDDTRTRCHWRLARSDTFQAEPGTE